MGFLVRAAIVIGTIYALSPLRDADEPLVPRAAQETLARGAQDMARQAVGAAVGLCRDHASACLQAASAAAPRSQLAPAPPPASAAPHRTPLPIERPRAAP